MELESSVDGDSERKAIRVESELDIAVLREVAARAVVARALNADAVSINDRHLLNTLYGVYATDQSRVIGSKETISKIIRGLSEFGEPRVRIQLALSIGRTGMSQIETAQLIVLSEYAAQEAAKLGAQMEGRMLAPEILPGTVDYGDFLRIIESTDPPTV